MNKRIREALIVILIIGIILTTTSIVYAENNTSEGSNETESGTSNTTITDNKKSTENTNGSVSTNTSTPSSTSTKTTKKQTTSTQSTATTTSKSSNANLSNLGIKPNDFSGFKENTTTYNVTVPEDIDKIEVYATAQNSSAKITGTGIKKLELGNNSVSVTVTAENGTTKTYTINITRQGESENTEEVSNTYSGNGLSSLKIGDLKLSPEFNTNIYEYTTTVIGEDEKIEVQAEATDPNYVLEITGNKELKEGENIITVLVSNPDGDNVATYQVVVNKKLVDEEAVAKEQEELKNKQNQNRKLIAIIMFLVILVIAIIIFLLLKRRGNKDIDDYYGDDYDDEYDEKESNYENEYEEYEEKPRKSKYKGKRFK